VAINKLSILIHCVARTHISNVNYWYNVGNVPQVAYGWLSGSNNAADPDHTPTNR